MDSASLLPLHSGCTRVKEVCASNCLCSTSTTSELPARKDVGFTMLNLFIGLSSRKCLASSWHWRFCNERKQKGSSGSREHPMISRDWRVQVLYRSCE
ncbi:hypothetical protein V6N13_092498 [Hibiscus sabdariffa]|uniref:Uncharacterized protein n=1 Tax=Hibiscus sabdariffa TaxID=183260 RepID=A0ABR2CD09_9ROSI